MGKTFPLSFSRMDCFESCEQKFDYLYVSKTVKDQGGEASLYGDRVHKNLEKHATEGEPLTPELKKFEGLVAKIKAAPGKKFFEYRMGVTFDHRPCDFFDPDVWQRAITDVLTVDRTVARILDWKTGKPRVKELQLKLSAAMTFEHFPEVNVIKTAYVWLFHDHTTPAQFERWMLPDLWKTIHARADQIERTIAMGVFKAKPSPLCDWCPAKEICPSRRRR